MLAAETLQIDFLTGNGVQKVEIRSNYVCHFWS